MTLMNLQLAGFSEKDINELKGLVTASNKSGFSQGNGSSANGCNAVETLKILICNLV